MAKHWFVTPETVRVDLGDGDWVEFKKELSYGERQELALADMRFTGFLQGEQDISLDLAQINIRSMAMWIVDWSLCDDAGNPMPVSVASIKALSSEAAGILEEALEKHKAEQEKNAVTTAGSTEPETK